MFVNFNILNQLGSPAINSNTFANRPAAGQTGRLFVSTDTYEIYRDNGTTWDLIGGPGSSTITGSGTATQVAYFTSSQAIGSSANLFWDNTSGFLGVATATPTARIEAVKTDGVGIYANFTTNAGSGSSTTAIWAKNVTNSSGFAAVIEETTPNTTAGQYPLLIKHSLSSGTAGVGMGTGLHFQLPDDAGTFKTTQLTIETINAAAATYATRYRFNVQNNGSSTPVAYINSTGLGIFTATPGAALDIHSTGIMAQLNSTSATGNTYIAFQRTGTGLWRIGDTYNAGNNFFELHNTVLAVDALEFEAATNKSAFQAQQTYTTGLARGNYFDFNLSVAAGGSFSSPNAITALGASLDLTLAGSATIPSGARSGLDAYNSIAFTGAGTLTHTQGTQIRAYSNVTAGWAFNGSAVGTITHLAGLRALFPDNSGSAIAITNNYALLLNDQTANTGTVTYTNRWGVYQEGASDLNYMAANLLLGSTTNSGEKLQVTGNSKITGNEQISGNLIVGGTNTYGATLTVYSSSTLSGGIGVRNSAGTPAGFFGTYAAGSGSGSTDIAIDSVGFINMSTGGSERIRVTSTGLVGIGTNTPAFKLDVQSSAGIGIRVQNTFNTDDAYLQAQTTLGSALFGINATGQYLYNGSAIPTLFYTNAVERMRISSTGRVGINNNNPGNYLDIIGGNGDQISLNNTGQRFTQLNFSNNNVFAGALWIDNNTNLFEYYAGTNWGVTIHSNGNERVRIPTSGNVLIGTTIDAGYKLRVNGSLLSGFSVFSTTGAGVFNSQISLQSSTSSPVLMAFENTANGGAFGFNSTTTQRFTFINGGLAEIASIDFSGNQILSGSIKTAAPNTGTAANWKLGSRVAATVVVNTTEYIEIDIGGTLYKLATVT